MAHTPTPWVVNVCDLWDVRDDARPGIPLFRADNGFRAWGRTMEVDERADNAAFVVRAVNAHDDLMAALRDVAETPLEGETVDGHAQVWDHEGALSRLMALRDMARAALAKATAL